MTTFKLEFEMLGLPKTTNAQTSMHYRAKQKMVNELHADMVLLTHMKRPVKPLKKAWLTLTRFSSSEPDYDNLVISFKHVIDGLIVCGIIENDKPANVGRPDYQWVKAKPKQGKIKVTIEGLE